MANSRKPFPYPSTYGWPTPGTSHARVAKARAGQDRGLADLEKYRTARAEAQKKANETGFDYGLERNDLFKEYRVFMLTQKQNRFGHELRCEVVSCENMGKCQKGHGPR